METIHEPTDGVNQKSRVARREFLRLGAIGGAAVAAGAVAATWMPDLRQRGLLSSDWCVRRGVDRLGGLSCTTRLPDDPLILDPFTDELPVPRPWRPSRHRLDELGGRPGTWDGQQNSLGNQKHQRWCAEREVRGADADRLQDRVQGGDALLHHLEGAADQHARQPTTSFDAGKTVAAGPPDTAAEHDLRVQRQFPGPMINAEYGQPALVRFINQLDENPDGLDRQDFGAPDYSFLTHLHNGAHRARERRQPALLLNPGPQSTTATSPACGSTTCT